MIDVNEILGRELETVSCISYFHHPPIAAEMPCISYYGVHTEQIFSTDNSAGFLRSHISVDVWSKTPSECGKIAVEANDVLTDSGWCYENMRDLAPEDGVYHKVLRFVRDFEI